MRCTALHSMSAQCWLAALHWVHEQYIYTICGSHWFFFTPRSKSAETGQPVEGPGSCLIWYVLTFWLALFCFIFKFCLHPSALISQFWTASAPQQLSVPDWFSVKSFAGWELYTERAPVKNKSKNKNRFGLTNKNRIDLSRNFETLTGWLIVWNQSKLWLTFWQVFGCALSHFFLSWDSMAMLLN